MKYRQGRNQEFLSMGSKAFLPRLKHEITTIRKCTLPQNYLIGFDKISQVTDVVGGKSGTMNHYD